MEVAFPFSQQPFQGVEVAPESSRNKSRLHWPIQEVSPFARDEPEFTFALLRSFHLPLDLVWREEVVGVQPLDVISLAKLECFVSRCRRPLIFLRNDIYSLGGESLSGCESLIARSII